MVYFKEVAVPGNDNITGLLVRGHAGYARKNKDDIVCSAISAIAQSALYGCSAYDKELVLNKIQKGYVHFICRKTPETNAVILAAVLGLNAIKEQYPQCFKQGD